MTQNKYINSELTVQHYNSISSQKVIFATNIGFHYMTNPHVDENGALKLKHYGEDWIRDSENQFIKFYHFRP
jgi:hypothetical protein